MNNIDCGQIAITIIVPVYNGEMYIERCLESLINQTIKNIEIIVIDDGSTDNSKNLIEKFRKKDKRIRAIYNTNHGVSYSRNIGIENATGEFIGFVDIDDYVDCNMFKFMHEKSKNMDVVYCGHISMNKHGNIREMPTKKEIILKKPCEIKEEIYKSVINVSRFCFGMCWNKIYRSELIKSNNIRFDQFRKIGEDFKFNLDVFSICKSCLIMPNCLYYYNKTNLSSTRKYIENMIDIDILNYRTRMAYLKIWNMEGEEYIYKTHNIFIDSVYSCIRNEIINNSQQSLKNKINSVDNLVNNKEVNDIFNNIEKNKLYKSYYKKVTRLQMKNKFIRYIYFANKFYIEKYIKKYAGLIIEILHNLGIEISRNKPFIVINR